MSSDKNDSPSITAAMHDGRRIPIATCVCPRCENQWFVPAWSNEFLPGWCCYCGLRFEGVEVSAPTKEEQP